MPNEHAEKTRLSCWQNYTPEAVRRALSEEKPSLEDLCALLSPAAEPFLEEMAQKPTKKPWSASATMSLLLPLSFQPLRELLCVLRISSRAFSGRKTLTPAEIQEECRMIRSQGFEQILLVSGESRKEAPLAYLKEAVNIARSYFHFVSMEVYPLKEEEYAGLVLEGLEGVTIFQETYEPEDYPKFHPAGPKANFEYRLDTLDRAARAGVRRLNLGALLGLSCWRKESLSLAFHLDYLKKPTDCETAISFSKIRNSWGFQAPKPMSDLHFTQMILALRMIPAPAWCFHPGKTPFP